MKPIVVGIDGGAPAMLALDWAAAEAELRNARLHVVCGRGVAPVLPTIRMASALEPHLWEDWPIAADRELADAVARASKVAPGIEITVSREPLDPGQLLVDLSETAQLVVVGSRGLGGFAGLLLGSVSLYVAGHARAPVVVVRVEPGSLRGPEQPPEILLGVDASAPATAATAFGFAEASRRGIGLRVLHAWTHPMSAGVADSTQAEQELAAASGQEARLLAEALAGWQERYPDVHVHAETRQDSPGRILTALSGQAELLVVGAHHRTQRIGLALGVVNHTLLHHALCPVALVPDSG
jgi:nucleotide-binding universal stress UspA family protein